MKIDNENQNKTVENPENGNKKGHSLVSKGFTLSLLTLASRVLGLIREMTKAKFLGTGHLGDAFGIAFQIPNFFRRLFAENSVSVAFIPTFKDYLEDSNDEEGKKRTQEFVASTFTLVTFLTVLLVTIGMIFAPLILKIFFKDEAAASGSEAVILTRIMFPYLVVISIAALLQGILNGLKIFSISGFTPILFNSIVIIFTYLFHNKMGNPARAMAVGVITGGTVQMLFQLPFVFKNNWKIYFVSLKKAFTNPGTRNVLRLIGPTVIGMAAYQLNDIISSALATRAGVGIYSSLSYSLRLQELILGICAVTIGTVILPDLTGLAKHQEWDDFSNLLLQSVKIMTFISIPITFYSLIYGENIITLVYGTGRFDENSIRTTTQVFTAHIIGLYFIAINRIVSQSFYAQQDSKRPAVAGLVNCTTNILLAWLFVFLSQKFNLNLEGPGIAFALTLASAVNTILLFIFLGSKKHFNMKKIAGGTLAYTLKMIIFSVIASVPVYFMRNPLLKVFEGHNRFISHGLPVAISALVFGIAGVLLMVITKDPLIKIALNKVRGRK